MTTEAPKPLRIFCSYSHRDEEHLNDLRDWLRGLERQELIEWWHDREISPGWEWEEAIDKNLRTADIILLLVSPAFMASDYVYEREISKAVERHDWGEAHVIPIIVRPADWTWASFGKLQALPKDARPITTWPNRDEAWLDVVRGIRKAVQELLVSARENLETQELEHQGRQNAPQEPLKTTANPSQPQASLNQRSRTKLKEPCLELSSELFQFVSERDKEDPVHTQWIADASDAELDEFSRQSSQYMNETMHLYDQQYAGRVMSLFELLEQRKLWNPEKLGLEERRRIQDPGTPHDIRDIARHLSRIGHLLDRNLDQSDYAGHQTENKQSKAETEPPKERSTCGLGHLNDEDLKRRCREMAEDLRQFLEDHRGKDRDEIMRLYRRNLGDRNLADEASVLLEDLEEHELYPPKNLKGYQIAANRYPRSPTAINDLATILGRIGRKK
jgi:hypothetical protein